MLFLITQGTDPDAETTDRGGRVALLFAAAIRTFPACWRVV